MACIQRSSALHIHRLAVSGGCACRQRPCGSLRLMACWCLKRGRRGTEPWCAACCYPCSKVCQETCLDHLPASCGVARSCIGCNGRQWSCHCTSCSMLAPRSHMARPTHPRPQLHSTLFQSVCCRLLMRFLPCWLPHDRVSADVQDSSEGIVKLWGEDALLNWPGALEPIIEERDMVMANVLRACASGMSWPCRIHCWLEPLPLPMSSGSFLYACFLSHPSSALMLALCTMHVFQVVQDGVPIATHNMKHTGACCSPPSRGPPGGGGAGVPPGKGSGQRNPAGRKNPCMRHQQHIGHLHSPLPSVRLRLEGPRGQGHNAHPWATATNAHSCRSQNLSQCIQQAAQRYIAERCTAAWQCCCARSSISLSLPCRAC